MLLIVVQCLLFWVQFNSESSRSDEVSSDGEEDDSPSLSPSSSRSCSRAEHSALQSDSSAPGSLPLEGAGFLSSTPSQWSVDEVYRFISSLQGWWSIWLQFTRHMLFLFIVSCINWVSWSIRLWGAGCPVSVSGNRRAGAAAFAWGPSHLHHEHQAGSRSQDLCLHQQPAWVMLPEGLQDCVLIANFSLKSTLGLLKKKKKRLRTLGLMKMLHRSCRDKKMASLLSGHWMCRRHECICVSGSWEVQYTCQ